MCAMQFALIAQVPESNRVISAEPASQHGVIVESVDKDSEGEKLGIKPGDVIDGWVRSTERGTIDSPFDFSWVEIEQKPRGSLSLEGHRGKEKQSWKFMTDQFGLKVRPVMRERLLIIYEDGSALATAGKVSEAATRWKRAADETSQDDPGWLASWLLSHAGWALVEFTHPLDAGTYFEEAVKRCPDDQPGSKEQLLYFWGFWNRNYASTEKSETLYRQALEITSAPDGNSLTAARYLEEIGVDGWAISDHAKAQEFLERSLRVREQIAPNSSAVASSLMWLSNVQQRLGKIDLSQTLLERAAEIDEKLAPHSSDMAAIAFTLGNVASYRGDQDRAEMYYSRSLAIDKKAHGGHPILAAPLLINLGALAHARGDDVAAERYWGESLAVSEAMPETGAAAVAHTYLGQVMVDDGRLDEAEHHLQRALDIQNKRKAGGLRVGNVLQVFGSLAFKRHQLPLALDYFEKTAALYRQVSPTGNSLADLLSDQASVLLKAGNLDKAEECFTEAAKLHEMLAPRKTDFGMDLAGLGSIKLRRGKFADATALYAKAIAVFEGQMSRIGEGSEGRSTYRASIADYYRDYVALLAEQGKPEIALDMLERSRARTLLELLDTAHADVRKGADAALLAQQKSLRHDINAKADSRASLVEGKKDGETVKTADEEISRLIKQYEGVQAKIRDSNADYAALTQPQPLASANIRKELLDADTVLLEYSLGEQRSYVFAVTTDSIKAFPIPSNAEIQKASVQLHSLLSSHPSRATQPIVVSEHAPATADLMRVAKGLSDMVLKPVAAQIAGKRVVVVADGALQYVPFAMLPDPETAASSDRPFAPLIVKHEVINLPSASVLSVLRRQSASRTRPSKLVAVLADPVFGKDDPRVASSPAGAKNHPAQETGVALSDRSAILDADLLTRSALDLGLSRAGEIDLPRLRYTRQEADAIKAAVPGTGALAALDFDASRTTATSEKLSDFRIVHFATHALANSEHPELSGLVFSLVDRNGNPQDGFLRLNDIYNLNLPADLIVLSSCETGLGKVIKGEGLIGLTRGFMYAGASRVVASLWNVSDVATAQLMGNFYRAMEKDKLPPAAALRTAQIAMWKQKRWNSPYFWAAFQIQGDWK